MAVVFFTPFLLHAQSASKVSGTQGTLSQYENNRPKVLINSSDAVVMPNGTNVLAKNFTLTILKSGSKDVELVASAPECILSSANSTAYSTNRLELHDANTNLFIEGQGFLWQSGDIRTLDLSNNVHTVIRRQTNGAASNPLEIYSDRFHFVNQTLTNDGQRAESSIATYTHKVRAEDDQMRLTCEFMTADISPTNAESVRNIVAETNVVIVSKSDQSRATGQKAVYINDKTNQLLELTGHPVWSDAHNEGRADTFFVERDNRIVHLVKNAQLTMPGGALIQPGMLSTKTNATATNQPVHITADYIDIDLPATNRVGRNLQATGHVQITANNTRAIGDAASFKESTGMLFLTNGTWTGEEFEAKGKLLTIDRTNKTFHAERDASLNLHAGSLGEVAAASKGTAAKGVRKPADRLIKIISSSYDVSTNTAVFHDHVRTSFPSGTNGLGTLLCDRMTVHFLSNKVETIVAQGHVDLHEVTTTTEKNVDKHVTCEELTVKLFPNGQTKLIIAQDNVVSDEMERELTTKLERHKKVTAGFIDIFYFSNTNQIQKIVAEKNVRLEQDASWAVGERAVYTNDNGKETAQLIGHPEGDVYQHNRKQPIHFKSDEPVNWDVKTGEITGHSVTFRYTPPAKTNANNLDLSPSKP